MFGSRPDRPDKPKKPRKPTKEDVWSVLADRLGGERVLDRGRRIRRVTFSEGERKVVLDTMTKQNGQSSEIYTRLRALYVVREEFRFRAYTRSAFSGLAGAIGMQDIRVGHPAVDPGWIVKGDSEGRIRSLLILPEVADCLGRVKSGRIEVRKYRRLLRSVADVRVLQFAMRGIATDEAMLESAIRMMFTALAHLSRIGVAMGRAPDVEL